MNGRISKKITRRLFLSTSGKLALGVAAILAGSSGLFYIGAVKQKGRIAQERPGSMIELGKLEQLTAINGVDKVSYEATIRDAWVTKSIKGFVYVTGDTNGELLVMSPSCTHLGCTIEPASEAERDAAANGLYFRCPCHGAEFDVRGDAIGGVVLQGLDTFKPIIADGRVYVDILSPIKGSAASS